MIVISLYFPFLLILVVACIGNVANDGMRC